MVALPVGELVSSTKIPGLKVQHSIITPACRSGRGELGAWDEAVERAKRAYFDTRAARANETANVHLVVTVERPEK